MSKETHKLKRLFQIKEREKEKQKLINIISITKQGNTYAKRVVGVDEHDVDE